MRMLDRNWTVLIVLVFLQLAFMGAMVALAAWSVHKVLNHQGKGRKQ